MRQRGHRSPPHERDRRRAVRDRGQCSPPWRRSRREPSGRLGRRTRPRRSAIAGRRRSGEGRAPRRAVRCDRVLAARRSRFAYGSLLPVRPSQICASRDRVAVRGRCEALGGPRHATLPRPAASYVTSESNVAVRTLRTLGRLGLAPWLKGANTRLDRRYSACRLVARVVRASGGTTAGSTPGWGEWATSPWP